MATTNENTSRTASGDVDTTADNAAVLEEVRNKALVRIQSHRIAFTPYSSFTSVVSRPGEEDGQAGPRFQAPAALEESDHETAGPEGVLLGLDAEAQIRQPKVAPAPKVKQQAKKAVPTPPPAPKASIRSWFSCFKAPATKEAPVVEVPIKQKDAAAATNGVDKASTDMIKAVHST